DFDFTEMVDRVRGDAASVKLGIVLGDAPRGFLSLTELMSRQPKRSPGELRKLRIDPSDPAIFQLSGGTTGVPKLIPRTHNDYAYNSKIAADVCKVTGESVLLLALPIAHNMPLACPGVQGTLFTGGKVVLSASTRPE